MRQSVNIIETTNPELSELLELMKDGRCFEKIIDLNWSKSAQYFPVCYF